ncbi:hypothetical protein M0R04_07175 [Candidatus Dojkabacteria bacterium]|jgi:hypothetical protein|nr:hypothetical protein [Candidatus Dojkabacteria bacterium]
MKLIELFEAMKVIPSDYDAEYESIKSTFGQSRLLPAHLNYLNRYAYFGAVLPIPELKKELAKLSDTDIMRFIIHDSRSFQYIPNPSNDVIKFALREDGLILKYLPKMGIPMTDEYIKIAVRSNGRAIGYVDNPTEEQMIRAVSRASQAIHNIIKPYNKKLTPGVLTPAVLAAANKKNPRSSTAVLAKHNMLDLEELKAAITTNPYVILQIKKPTPEVIKIVLTSQNIINMERLYDKFLRKHLGNNALLTKKWLRYGETMRNQE